MSTSQVPSGPFTAGASRPAGMLDQVIQTSHRHADRISSLAGRLSAIADDLVGSGPPTGSNGGLPKVAPGSIPRMNQAAQAQGEIENALDYLASQIDRLTTL